METMKSTTILATLVAMFAIVAIVASATTVSAFATIDSLQVNGVIAYSGQTLGVQAGEVIPVRVVFTGTEDMSDVRVSARLTGETSLSEYTEKFDVIAGSQYSELLNIQMPYDIDPSETYILEVSVESNSVPTDDSRRKIVYFEVQRENYVVDILSLFGPDTVNAGQTAIYDVVLKNRGRHFAEDTYVRARILELPGVVGQAYFGDLAPEDQGGDVVEKEDAVERKFSLNIPANAAPGVYTIEVQAFNSDSVTTTTKKIVIGGSSASNVVYSSSDSKTFSAGETGTYTLTLVNSGNSVQVYDLVIDGADGLNVELSESVIVVPAGSSKTVEVSTTADKAGEYNFAVNVHSNGALVSRESFTANVEGSGSANAAVLLTVVLAIIFVVLLVVLIVLLTRKPAKAEEFGESYY